MEKRLSNIATMFADGCSRNTKMAMPVSNSIVRCPIPQIPLSTMERPGEAFSLAVNVNIPD
ncbi:MAG: hypothetical protein AAEJ43_10700 [Gammaproteobacteria bacterium]